MKTKTVPFPSDFEKKDTIQEKVAQKHLGRMGRMVGGSKSIYQYDNPDNYVIFNANILTKEDGKIWYGDLDITNDLTKLRDVAKDLGKNIFVFYESDARFGNEQSLDFSRYALEIHSYDGRTILRDNEFFYFKDNNTILKRQKKEPKNERISKIFDRSDYLEIELPDPKTIKVTKKLDPLSQFQRYFIEKYGHEDAVNIYQNLYVTRSYYEKLESLAVKYCKKQYPGLHPVKVEQSVAWYMLDASPGSFLDDQPWEKPNTGYIKK